MSFLKDCGKYLLSAFSVYVRLAQTFIWSKWPYTFKADFGLRKTVLRAETFFCIKGPKGNSKYGFLFFLLGKKGFQSLRCISCCCCCCFWHWEKGLKFETSVLCMFFAVSFSRNLRGAPTWTGPACNIIAHNVTRKVKSWKIDVFDNFDVTLTTFYNMKLRMSLLKI